MPAYGVQAAGTTDPFAYPAVQQEGRRDSSGVASSRPVNGFHEPDEEDALRVSVAHQAVTRSAPSCAHVRHPRHDLTM